MSPMEKELEGILSSFEAMQKSEKLAIGSMDERIKEFIQKILNGLIKYHLDEEKYFSFIEILDKFIDEMRYNDNGTDWMVWCNIDFGKLSLISSGVVEDMKVLEEIKEYYC
ncbi:hypothetical protein GW932_02235 [archaeon]|nr:hypothetical protein [archaeon]